jgi:hypothetical protein
MTTPLTFVTVPQGSVAGWDVQLKSDLITLRDRQDRTPVTLYWDSGVRVWPSIPPGLPTGTVIIWDSLNDATATAPPNAVTGHRWFKRDA